MSKKDQKTGQKDIIVTVHELAQLMKGDPRGIDNDLRKKGDDCIVIYQDFNFSDNFQNLRQQKIHVIEMVVRDISEGVLTLRSSSIGVSFSDGKMVPFVTPHGSSPRGTIVYSIGWRDSRAFHNWRTNSLDLDVSQDDINVAIYRLAVEMQEVLP